MVYDGFGLRVSKTDSTGSYAFLTAGQGVASPVLTDGQAVYSYGLGLTSEFRNGQSRTYASDHLGSTRFLNTGSVPGSSDLLDYDAFGNRLDTNASGTSFQYAGDWGYQADKDSRLMLLGHRYYDPEIGRFLSQDPIQDGRNWYAYVQNNPVGNVDPNGLEALPSGSGPGLIVVEGGAGKPPLPVKWLPRIVGGGARIAGPVAATAGAFYEMATYKPGKPSGPLTWLGEKLADLLFPQEKEEEDDDEHYVLLFRGVCKEHPGYPQARAGMAFPRGGSADPEAHNKGDTLSNFTSWTGNRDIAYGFATQGTSREGIILKKWFNIKLLIISPDEYSEGEWLVPGPVIGAVPIPVKRP